jgi:hypothetical protein
MAEPPSRCVACSVIPAKLRPRFNTFLGNALLETTRKTNAWIITAGTTGFMEVIGSALASQQTTETLLGIVPWGAVHGRTQLQEQHAGTSEAAQLMRARTVCLVGLGTQPCLQHRAEIRKKCCEFGDVIQMSIFRQPSSTPTPGKVYVYDGVPCEQVVESNDIDAERRKSGWTYFALVTFKQSDSAFLMCASSRAESDQDVGVDERLAAHQAEAAMSNCSLYVRGDVGEDEGDLKKLFGRFGTVCLVTVCRVSNPCKESGSSWALLTMDSETAARRAVGALEFSARHSLTVTMFDAATEALNTVSSMAGTQRQDLSRSISTNRSVRRNQPQRSTKRGAFHVYKANGETLFRFYAKRLEASTSFHKLRRRSPSFHKVRVQAELLRSEAESHAYELHVKNTVRDRGSVEFPYHYTGHKSPKASSCGTALDPNHSHYLLVDDGIEGQFGGEIELRSELENFLSYRLDLGVREKAGSKEAGQRLVHQIKRVESGQKMQLVPVICFVFNGGNGTIETVETHMKRDNAIIVFQGTGRFADLFTSWLRGYAEMEELARHSSAKPHRLLERQDALLRAWVTRNPVSKSASIEQQMSSLRERLDAIVTYPLIMLFDGMLDEHTYKVAETNNEGAGTIEKMANRWQFNVRSRIYYRPSAPKGRDSLLSLVLRIIFGSSKIHGIVRIPLAIRTSSQLWLQRTLAQYGPIVRELALEQSRNASFLVYTACLDKKDECQTLLECGFDVQEIDQLIYLELHQFAAIQAVQRHKQTRAPPPEWIRAEMRRAKRRSLLMAERTQPTWESMRRSEQLQIIEQRWNRLSQDDRDKITVSSLKRISWAQLPLLHGWIFRVVLHVPASGVDSTYDIGLGRYLGRKFMEAGVEWDVVGKAFVRLVAENDNLSEAFQGEVVTSAQARQLCFDATVSSGDTLSSPTTSDDAACMPVRKTCCWLLTKALHKHKTVTFPPNINRLATSHLAEDLTGE